ncbi:MAG: alpha-amylase, partial [Ignavibacteria bacterium]|nr:alpha-amylase [Ignavibacteria bacterium]
MRNTRTNKNRTVHFKENKFSTFEFHIAKDVRKKYQFDDLLFSMNGNVVFADFHSVRLFVQKINSQRTEIDKVKVGHINAVGLLDEIYHFIFRIYETNFNPGVFNKALKHLHNTIGEEETRKVLFDFTTIFPPMEVYRGKVSVFDYLNSYTASKSNVEISLEEMILLHFANINPSNKNIIELFGIDHLEDKELFAKVIEELDKFFIDEAKIDDNDLFTFLKTPIFSNPHDLEAQLEFIREKWGVLIDEKFLRRIFSSKDLYKEDIVLGFGGFGGASTAVPIYKSDKDSQDFLVLGKSGFKYAIESWKDYAELENFTPDTDWMPRVVMIAKNIYVWLDQLSKKYQRQIKTLDQIPDEEIDTLAQWGFNGLWLIGIWERSNASKKIKHILGNIDAVSSAYSLYDYQIAWELGGEYAYNNLNERARKRGIRLASDMVP